VAHQVTQDWQLVFRFREKGAAGRASTAGRPDIAPPSSSTRLTSPCCTRLGRCLRLWRRDRLGFDSITIAFEAQEASQDATWRIYKGFRVAPEKLIDLVIYLDCGGQCLLLRIWPYLHNDCSKLHWKSNYIQIGSAPHFFAISGFLGVTIGRDWARLSWESGWRPLPILKEGRVPISEDQ
jgi:hypothetical protein